MNRDSWTAPFSRFFTPTPAVSAALQLLLSASATPGASELGNYAKQADEWFRSEEGRRIVGNVLSWQAPSGAWPKNTDTTSTRPAGSRAPVQGTFDNGATTGELRLLARAFRATGERRVEHALLNGLDHILAAQYTNGGWPQFHPPGTGYHRHITFNDDAMVRLLEFVREVAASDGFKFVVAERRRRAQAAFDRGVDCILRCQIVVDGRLTAWCAQHDESTLEPRPGRAFEPAALSGAESAAILRLLMSIEDPSPGIRRAIAAGVAWFEAVPLRGVRVTRVDGDKRLVQDADAPPLWARFYEIGTNRPIFAGRDGVKKYDLSEIEAERRNGYAWHGDWGRRVAAEFEKWRQRRESP